MNPSYFRIRLPIQDALNRFSKWVDLPELGSPKKVKAAKAVDAACKNGDWRSIIAVFIYESGEWTVFDDLTGHLASYAAKRWRSLAGRNEFVLAGYNDAVPYGQLIVIRAGRVVREYLDDEQNTRQNVNRGKLRYEKESPIEKWTDVESFVDSDEILAYPETGVLWMFGKFTR